MRTIMFNSGKNKFIKVRCVVAFILAIVLALACVQTSFASSPTDEILNYEITADVNDDASVSFIYHIDWKVLDDSIGALEWVEIGIPNSHCSDINAISSNIENLYQDGNYLKVYFDKSYYENEVVSFDFAFVMDNLYQMNGQSDGYTTYSFTPGWFDEIAVDNLVIRWNCENVESWSPDCYIDGDYNTWTTSLAAGEKYKVTISYPNDAYAFTESSSYQDSDGYSYSYSSGSSLGSIIFSLVGVVISIAPVAIFIILIIVIRSGAKRRYEKESGFANGETKTKVTRTKIVYYDTCPGCGAPRSEGKSECEFCGRSLIKSEEVIEEKDVKDEDKDALKYNKDGEYHYSSDPNTFVRVNVVHIPVVNPVIFPHSGISHGGHAGGNSRGPRPPMGGGGCAHSSCACVSCACACACACAGGGRAGCSTKDFYKIKVKNN